MQRLRIPTLAIVLFYACAMLYATWQGFTAPYKNFDMIGYVGSVVSWQEKDPVAIYAKTMGTVQENVSEALYKDLSSNSLSNEPKAFVEQLPIYQVKPLYNVLVWLVHQTGIALPAATWAVSSYCFAILSVILFYWRGRSLSREAWLLLVVALTYLWPWPMNSLACLSTPDSVATLLTMCALLSWLMRRSFRLYCIFSWLAVMDRPDALILCSALAAYFALFAPAPYRMPVKGAFGLIIISYLSYLIVSRWAGNYGLERWFIYAFINKVPYPAEETDHLTLQSYWDVIAPSTVLFVSLGRTIMMLGFTALAGFCYYMCPAGNRMWLQLMLLTWLCLIVRFLMFPAWGDDRYYFCYYLPILLSGGELIATYTSVLWQMFQAHRKAVQNL